MFSTIRVLWRSVVRRSRWESDLEDELRDHVERRTADLIHRGLDPVDAERRARVELGGRESYKDECRAVHRVRWFDELWQDLRYALRALRRSPAFAAVAILSLALGIGANSVVFSVVNALILKPLPVTAPEQLFFVQTGKMPTQSYPNYRELRDRNTTLSGLVAYRPAPMALEQSTGAHRVWGYLATGNYFDTLGVQPVLGRFFHAEDDRKPGASAYAVLSYNCWRNRFASDPSIVGRTIRINGLPYSVLGVAPAGFHGTEVFYWPELWAPMMMQPQIEGRSWLDERSSFNCWLMGRLKSGVGKKQAEADLTSLYAALSRENPISNEARPIVLAMPGLIGDSGGAPIRAFMAGVMGLAALVLIASCINLASLVAARASDRSRELAIRLSIGAGRWRIFRQLITESFVLSILGGAAGWFLAYLLASSLSSWRAPLDFPVQFQVNPDWRVFLFSAATALVSGALFGIAPARQAWRSDPNRVLKGTASGARIRRWRLRDLLVAVQVALCCVLVTGCFVSFRGLARVFTMPMGFEPRNAAVASFDLELHRVSQSEGRALQARALDAVSRLPGVTAAGFASSMPLSLDQSTTTVFAESATDFRLTAGKEASYYFISPGYLRASGTPLISGRDFEWRDDVKAPSVAIVNETFARRVVGTRDAVGRRFKYAKNRIVEIVGVVADGKYKNLTEESQAALFQPAGQSYNGTTVLVARSTLPEAELARAMRQAISALDPSLPLYGVGSVAEMLHLAFLPSHAAAIALGAFGVLAVMLAVTGIYGVAAYAVSRRVREIGIRVAVGARPTQVLRFVLGRSAMLLAAGTCAGLLLGIAFGQVLGTVVYHASARDPITLAGVAVTLAAIGFAAALGPARRALSIDPLQSLRQE